MLGIYCRISKNREGQKSIKEQQLQGEEFAKLKGLKFKVYKDEGISGGGKTDKRDAFTNLINDIEKNLITTVYLTAQDRLEREEVTWFTFANLILDKEIALYEDGEYIDLDNISVWFARGVQSQANAFYRKGLSKKIKQVLYRNLSEGKVHSIPPYGYKKNKDSLMVIDEEESLVIKKIFKLSLDGIVTNKIAEILNSENIPTRYNKIGKGTLTTINKRSNLNKVVTRNKAEIKWSGNTIRGIIKNPVYKGVRIFKKVEYTSPIIIEQVIWQKAQDNLQKNRNNSGKVVEHKYLLKGMLTCGRCGRNYYGRSRINLRDNAYICSSKRIKTENCGNRGLNIPVLDKIIWTRFIGDGEILKLIENHFNNINTSDIITDIENEIINLNKQLRKNYSNKNKLLDLYLSGIITKDDINGKMNFLKSEIETLNLKIHNLNEQLDSFKSNEFSLESIKADLDFNPSKISYNDKKDILKKYLKEIVIYYDDVENYFLEIKFNIQDMPNEVLVLNKDYKFTHSIINENSKFENIIIITINDKLSEEFKRNKSIDIKLMINSKQQFDKIKSIYN